MNIGRHVHETGGIYAGIKPGITGKLCHAMLTKGTSSPAIRWSDMGKKHLRPAKLLAIPHESWEVGHRPWTKTSSQVQTGESGEPPAIKTLPESG